VLFVLCRFGSIFSSKRGLYTWPIDGNHHRPQKQTPHKAGIFSGLSLMQYQGRESSDKPKLKAFLTCRTLSSL